MNGEVKYGKTVKVFFGKREADDEVRFDVTYYILKTEIEANEIKTDTYGIQIDKIDFFTDDMESAEEIDISLNLFDVEVLAKRLYENSATPQDLHSISEDFVQEINCLPNVS